MKSNGSCVVCMIATLQTGIFARIGHNTVTGKVQLHGSEQPWRCSCSKKRVRRGRAALGDCPREWSIVRVIRSVNISARCHKLFDPSSISLSCRVVQTRSALPVARRGNSLEQAQVGAELAA